jgi:hypothetical protein
MPDFLIMVSVSRDKIDELETGLGAALVASWEITEPDPDIVGETISQLTEGVSYEEDE